MNKFLKNIILLVFVLLCSSNGFSLEPVYDVIFNEVYINGEIVNKDSILIGENDTIKFSYYCNIENAKKTPFLFRIELKNHQASAVKSWNESSITYHNLPKSEYEFKVSAFDIKKNWEADPKSIFFEVDGEKLKLKEENIQLISKLDEKKTDEKKTQPDWIKLLISFLLGAIIVGVISAIRWKKTQTNSSKQRKKGQTMEEKQELERKLQLLQQENSGLKTELANLRAQIENLQKRTSEMKAQNRELEDSIQKINDTKAEVERLQEQKDDLFAMLIHDIKNPAGIIKSLVELLKGYDLSAIDQQEIMDDIVKTSKKIVQLSNEVSRVLALESGNLYLNKQTANVQLVVENVYRRFKVKAKEKNILLIFNKSINLPEIEFDEDKIDEILSNLVSNAIKFTQDGGSVRIKTQKIDSNIVFEVSDNGQGLSQEDLQLAFKRGAQLSARPTGGETSTGLGLWIVKKLVEAHNGRVWVRSSVGKGATFAFSLPINDILDAKELQFENEIES